MPADLGVLLAEAPWLARLARSLTGDPAEADDIVQETYAAALRSPPDTERPLRPWLRRVAVNLARMRHRGRARRAATETAAEAQLDPVRTPEQLVERAQLERRLAELVLELDEPFRTTVLLRYREGYSAEQIAQQQGIPAGTVRSRLKTALDRIRRALDDRERTRMHAVFVAPLLGAPRGPAPAPPLGRIVMAKITSKTALAVVALLLLLLGGALVLRHRGTSASRDAAGSPTPPAPGADAHRTVPQPAMFVQPRVAARRVRGRVTSEGAPYRGALVQLVHAQTEVVLAQARSGSDGSFDLGDRPADVYIVTASAPDRAAVPVQIDLRAPSTAEVELRLAGCSHVRGSVVDGSGAPIAHARIARSGVPAPAAETDAHGRYDFCTHFGSLDLFYSASGFQSVVVSLDVATSATRDVVLIPEATVEGKVVTTDGTPVAGAFVVIDPSELGNVRNARAIGFSETDGSFRIAGVSPGRNLVSGFARGLRSSHKQELVVGAGQTTSGIVVQLYPTATISGVVVSGGAPVAGVGVGMRIGNRDEQGVLAVTQADGSFAIDRAPRGDVALYVEKHTVIAPRSVHIADAPSVVRIEVETLGGVHGRVLRDGQPVADAQVSCFSRPTVFTDATGDYACDGLPDGPQEVVADVSSGEWGSGTVTVKRGEIATLDIALTFSAAICGRISDEAGAPVAGLDVHVAEQTTNDYGQDTTGADGTFCARKLTGGTYNASVYAAARRLVPREPLAAITLGPRETKQIAIRVTAPRLSIAGSVHDPRGAPVVDAIVRVVPPDEVGADRFGTDTLTSLAITDESGHFEVGKLAAGNYIVIAAARDGSEALVQPVAAGIHDVAITIAAAGRIEGTLVGFTTPPAITVAIKVGTHPLISAEVDGDHFRASGLSPGTYVLMAVTDAWEADTEVAVVQPGETTQVTMASRGTATVAGTVRDFRTKAPVSGVRCDSLARNGDAMGSLFIGPDHAVLADAQGAFRMTSTAGEIEVVCIGPQYAGTRMAVATQGKTTVVDVWAVATTQNAGTIDASMGPMTRVIAEITRGGAADRAGLALGDEVIEVDGASVVELGERATMLLITQRPAGAPVALTFLRGGVAHKTVVTVRGAD